MALLSGPGFDEHGENGALQTQGGLQPCPYCLDQASMNMVKMAPFKRSCIGHYLIICVFHVFFSNHVLCIIVESHIYI